MTSTSSSTAGRTATSATRRASGARALRRAIELREVDIESDDRLLRRDARADPGGRGRRRGGQRAGVRPRRVRSAALAYCRAVSDSRTHRARRPRTTATDGAVADGDRLSLGVAARLSRYLQVLIQARKMGRETISSQELAEYTHINSTQIRRDLSGFGKFGKRGVGYRVESLVARDPQDPPHLGPAQHRAVRRRQPRPGDRQLGHLRRPRLPDRRDLRRRPEAGRRASSAASRFGRSATSSRSSREEEVVVGVLAVPAQAPPRQVADQLVEAGVKIIFNYSEQLLAGAAGGHRPHLEPRRRPALRALLLPGLNR